MISNESECCKVKYLKGVTCVLVGTFSSFGDAFNFGSYCFKTLFIDFALPDHHDCPTKFLQCLCVALVSIHIVFEFSFPK